MIITRYEMEGKHTKEGTTFDMFMSEYNRFLDVHLTPPTRVEMSPIYYSDVTASADARKYALGSENKSYYIKQINGLDIVLSTELDYDTHRFVFEKIVSK